MHATKRIMVVRRVTSAVLIRERFEELRMSIKAVLENARDKNSLVSVYVDSDDWGRFSVGYVDAITDSHVRLRAVSKYGEPAGYEVRPLAEIFKVEFDGRYEKKIERLNQNQGKIFNEILPQRKSAGDLIVDALRQSLDESVVIVVWGADIEDSLVGYVEQLENDVVTLRLINEYGEDDGRSSIEIDEITSVDFNTQSEQVRKFLFANEKNRPRR